MRIKPIPMSVDSVRRIRERLKTESRRVIVPQPIYRPLASCSLVWGWKGKRYTETEMRNLCTYQIGDLLWVREPLIQGPPPSKEVRYESDGQIVLRWDAPSEGYKYVIWQWKRKYLPSRYMPGYAARTYLKLVNRNIEELQAISEASVISEGFPSGDRQEFKMTWNTLNQGRGYGWNADPWNWVLNFSWEELLEYADLEALKSRNTIVRRNFDANEQTVR